LDVPANVRTNRRRHVTWDVSKHTSLAARVLSDAPKLLEWWRAGCEGLDESKRPGRGECETGTERATTTRGSWLVATSRGKKHHGTGRGRQRRDLHEDDSRFRKALGVNAGTIHQRWSMQDRSKQPERHRPAAPEPGRPRSQNAGEASGEHTGNEPSQQKPRLEELPFPRLAEEQPHVKQREAGTGCDRSLADHPDIVVVLQPLSQIDAAARPGDRRDQRRLWAACTRRPSAR
jgi:hypothetical protein